MVNGASVERTIQTLPPAAILMLSLVLCASGLYIAADLICSTKLYQHKPFRCLCLLTPPILAGLAAFFLPISPINDSMAFYRALAQFLEYGALSPSFTRPYFAFYANNLIALMPYRVAVMLANDVRLGVRLVNFLCAFIAVFCFSCSVGKIFGKNRQMFSALICTLLFPYIILTSPYIYPISIALTSLVFCLSFPGCRAKKPFLFLVTGILFLMRPTAAILVFVSYAFLTFRHFIRREKTEALKSLGVIILLFVSLYVTQLGVGAALLRAGLHPFPNLLSGSTNWTLDIGTRFDGFNTGSSTYVPYGALPQHLRDDEIAVMQNRVWNYLATGDINDLQNLTNLNRELRAAIANRTVEIILYNPTNIPRFYFYKSARLFGVSAYRLYFYSLNVHSPTFGQELRSNIEADAEVHFLAVIILSAIGIVFAFVRCIIKRRFDDRALYALSSAMACIAVIFIVLSLTEVAQRTLLDIFIPAAFAICSMMIFLMDDFDVVTRLATKSKIIAAVLLALGLIVAGYTFSSNNLGFLRGADFELSQEDGIIALEITLTQDPPAHGHYFVIQEQQIPLSRRMILEIEIGETLYLQTPRRIFRISTFAY